MSAQVVGCRGVPASIGELGEAEQCGGGRIAGERDVEALAGLARSRCP